MSLTSRKRWIRLPSAVAIAAIISVAGCGGSSKTNPPAQNQPDPVAYVITGIDAVPDQLPGYPDIGVVPEDPANLRNPNVYLVQPLYNPCGSPGDLQYTTATQPDVGVGTKHYKISGQPANVTIDELTGLVIVRHDSGCVAGGYTYDQYIDAESNGKTARSNTMHVRIGMY